ncbi:hypothetical protein HPB48_008860 [Haemaphysalis longicornis]|uniref:Uncharacterized protein n=1 Tax=Haemaphysalis longicornis TaxID=44386 RepID=A0A9J6GQG7_HAELO|nr:hypothetical protein HPB48_008860 [Haemaphysalis longicornis]
MDDACGRWERRRRACRLTDWHKWREARERRLGEQGGPNIVDIELWTREILLDVEHHTRKIEAPDGVPAVDSHLLHIWDARESLTKRWRRQPLNRKLRRRVAQLSKEAEDYAIKLVNQNWRKFCDSMSGQLGVAKTWKVLKSNDGADCHED